MTVTILNNRQIAAQRSAEAGVETRPVPELPVLNDTSAFREAQAFWENETFVGDLAANGSQPFQSRSQAVNPYSYFLENEERLGDLRSYFENGYFEDDFTPESIEWRVERIRTEEENREIMANSSTLGTVLGMGASLVDVDVTAFIPGLNVVSRGVSTLRTAASVSAMAAGGALATETALQSRQELREIEESVVNVLGAGVLGAGLGAVAGTMARRGPQAREYFNAQEAVIDLQEVPVGLTSEEARNRSVGAAEDEFGGARDELAGNPHGSFFQRWNYLPGPFERAIRSPARTAREAAINVFETGGQLLNRSVGTTRRVSINGQEVDVNVGQARQRTVESTRNEIYNERFILPVGELNRGYERIVTGLGLASSTGMASLRSETGDILSGFVGQNRVQLAFGTDEFQRLVIAKGLKFFDDSDRASLRERFGAEGQKLIEDEIDRWMNNFTQITRRHAERMVKNGILTENQVIEDYVFPQLWDYSKIVENREEFVAFMAKKIVSMGPPESWIAKRLDDGESIDSIDDVRRARLEQDWADEMKLLEIDELEAEIKATTRRAKDLERDLGHDLRTLGTDIRGRPIRRRSNGGVEGIVRSLEKELERLGKMRANAWRKNRTAMTDMAKAERDLIRAEGEAFTAAAQVSRSMTRDRLNADPVPNETFEIAEGRVSEAERKLIGFMSEFSRSGRARDAERGRHSPSDLTSAIAKDTDYQRLVAALGAADARYQRLIEKTPEGRRSARTSTLEAKARRREMELRVAEKRYADLDDALTRITAKVEKLDEAKAASKAAKDNAKAMRSELAKQRGTTEKELAKLQRKLKKEQGKELPSQIAKDVLANLSKSAKTPTGFLPSELYPSGRTKTRTINLTPEEARLATAKGWLQQNTTMLLERSATEVGTRVGMKEVLGTTDFEEFFRPIQDEYEMLIQEAAQAGNQARVNYLTTDLDRQRVNLDHGFQRLFGTAGIPDNPSAPLVFLLRTARNVNLPILGLWFGISSMTDLATTFFTTGGHPFRREFWKAGKQFRTMLKDLDRNQIAAMLHGAEASQLRSRALAMAGTDDNMVVGMKTGVDILDRISRGVDLATTTLANKTMVVNGMAAWNMHVKAIASMMQLNNIHKAITGWDGLPDSQKIIMRDLGFDESNIGWLRKYVEIEDQFENDLFIPDYAKWGDSDEALEAVSIFNTALMRTQDRSVLTAGAGDTHRYFDTTLGKALLQFQTFGFVSVNKVVAPMLQQMNIPGRQKRVMATAMTMLVLGAFNTVARDMIYNRERNLDDPAEFRRFVYESVDRSGALAYMSIPLDVAMKGLGLQGSTRFARNSALDTLLGPSWSLANNAWQTGTAVADGNLEQAGEKVQRLLPFAQAVQALNAHTQ